MGAVRRLPRVCASLQMGLVIAFAASTTVAGGAFASATAHDDPHRFVDLSQFATPDAYPPLLAKRGHFTCCFGGCPLPRKRFRETLIQTRHRPLLRGRPVADPVLP